VLVEQAREHLLAAAAVDRALALRHRGAHGLEELLGEHAGELAGGAAEAGVVGRPGGARRPGGA
jgi:hypothetical protein